MSEPSLQQLAAAMRGLSPLELIEKVLILEDGRTYGEAMTEWQRADFEAIVATHPDGRPVHRLCYLERRRGESKTQDSAAVAVADLIVGPRGHRSYAVASSSDQAQLLLDSVEAFRDRSPFVNAAVRVHRFVVKNLGTGSELRVMSADDKTSYGIRPRKVFFDELSLQPDDRLWKAMWSAIGKRADAQMVVASMCGWEFGGFAWKVREMVRLNG